MPEPEAAMSGTIGMAGTAIGATRATGAAAPRARTGPEAGARRRA